MSVDQKLRYDILEIVFHTSDPAILSEMKKRLESIKDDYGNKGKKPRYLEAAKPTKDFVSLEDLKIQQNYKPISFEEFRAIADEIEFEESLDELLEMI